MNEEILEQQEWVESLEDVLRQGGAERAKRILTALHQRGARDGIDCPYAANTPYVNTIPVSQQPRFPGNREIERRIKSLIRWNAMVMVVRANREEHGIGGHISSYASSATLLEVAFNHFLRGKDHPEGGDQVYFQGHASPGIYARAFLEGRLTQQQLDHFRRELKPGGGLSSYPHPYLMPDFWEFPTVSMGLGPIMAIYQARFNRYLEDRGLVKKTGRVWAFLGDGETDEPESLGAISLAAREKLDNLTFVINCNLQRLDGPVRGNGKIIQELERNFRGSGWNVVKVIWGDSWDPLLERDAEGVLVKRMEEACDGDYQRFTIAPGSDIREHFFGTDPRLAALVESLTDDELRKLKRGGHDPEKVFAAYKTAEGKNGAPTVILAKTIKGYGLGESGEGKNITHQQKQLNEDALKHFRTRFAIPLTDEEVSGAAFHRPSENSEEIQYLKARREALGGPLPQRRTTAAPLESADPAHFAEFHTGSEGREVSTTMVFTRLLAKLLRDPKFGKRIVPIVPDEARTFGMEALFRQVGIYSHVGQRYQPVDRETLLYYKEATDGQILEEGITEAGSMSSFIAAGTAYATHGIQMAPFFTFYSMFGFQRVGDLIWAAGDMRCRGFLIGATSGRTTLAGEGLQHQDGHSHILAHPFPHVAAYDPAFAYELAVIVEEGIREMFVEQKDRIYYLTVGNEPYAMPAMPEGSREGILKGLYCLAPEKAKDPKKHAKILGSGALLHEAIKAKELLGQFGVTAEIWSATSYKNLYRDAVDAERWNRLHLGEKEKVPYVQECLGTDPGVVVAVSDYSQALPLTVGKWMGDHFTALGTDGFGRSESRASLRDFFEVDAKHIAAATLSALAKAGGMKPELAIQAFEKLGIDPQRPNPLMRP